MLSLNRKSVEAQLGPVGLTCKRIFQRVQGCKLNNGAGAFVILSEFLSGGLLANPDSSVDKS